MNLREIKKEDIKAGAVLIPRKFDPKKADHEKVEIESVIEKNYLGINSATFKGGMWDSVGAIMKRYYLVESEDIVRRAVTEQDLVSGAIIKNGNAEHVVHRVSNGVVHYMDGCSDTLNIVLDFFEIDDKPTDTPTFDGDINQQIGGTHYAKNDPIQFAKDNYPLEHLEGFYRINVDKYMARYDKKNGIEDIKKAKHYIEMLLELKEQQNAE